MDRFAAAASLFRFEWFAAPWLIAMAPGALAFLLRRHRTAAELLIIGPVLAIVIPYLLTVLVWGDGPNPAPLLTALLAWPIAIGFALIAVVSLLFLETQRDPRSGKRLV